MNTRDKNKEDYIYGIRAVIEAIESGKSIDKVLVRRNLEGELSAELMQKIREYGVLMQRVPQERLNRITMKNHQGVIAITSPVAFIWVPSFRLASANLSKGHLGIFTTM